jgi:hypothetical protein
MIYFNFTNTILAILILLKQKTFINTRTYAQKITINNTQKQNEYP